MTTDDELISRCRTDPKAFRELLGRYQRRLYSFLLHMAGREAADDLFQETFVRILENGGRYQARGKPASWIFKIANNVALDYLNKRGNKAGEGLEEAERLPEPAPGPLAVLEREETKRRVAAALKRLPEDQRRVFLMREYGELSFREIAEELDIPLGTALSRMNYAVQKLRAELEESRGA